MNTARPSVALHDAISLFITLRLGLGVLAVLVWAYFRPWAGPCHQEVAFADWSRFPPLNDQVPAFPLLGVWQRWDACWYEAIAAFGYEPQHAGAFFPLLPALTRVVSLPLGNLTLAAHLVSGVAYVVAAVGLHHLVARDFDTDTARRAVLYLSVFPAAFFLYIGFTESLFLATSIWALLAARSGRWSIAAGAGLLAGLTRTHGLLLVLPLAWEAFVAFRGLRRRTAGEAERHARRVWILAPAAVLAPIIGFGAFTTFVAMTTGQSPMEAQGYWGGANFEPPWRVVAAAWSWITERGDVMQAINLVMLLGAVALAIVGLRWLPASYSLYLLPHLVILGTRILPTPLTSTSRFVLVLFPIFVVAALIGADRQVHRAWLIGSILLLGFLAHLFIIGDFVA